MIIIVEGEHNGHGSGGHFWGAVFDDSLRVAPYCTLHGIKAILPYTAEAVGGF